MARIRKIIILTLLVSMCAFPATAFATSKNSSQDGKKHFFSGLFSIFTPPPKPISSPPPANNIKDDLHSFFDDLFDWFNDKKDDFKDWHEWEDDHKDSLALWKKYYCW